MPDLRDFRRAATIGGLTLLLLPIPSPVCNIISGLTPLLNAQISNWMRQRPAAPNPAPPSGPARQPNAETNPQAPAAASAAPSNQFSAGPQSALPPSLLEQPAKPAQISFSAGMLSISADNSSLGGILHTLAKQSGMEIQGLGADERVFGTFGPGKPKDVLSDLLNGTPYNILMVGDLSNGAPDKLILMPATQTATSSTPAPAATPPANADDADADDAQPRPEPLPRGQIPPGFMQGRSTGSTTEPPAAKTPQQLFQELLTMRQQQQQQQEEQQSK